MKLNRTLTKSPSVMSVVNWPDKVLPLRIFDFFSIVGQLCPQRAARRFGLSCLAPFSWASVTYRARRSSTLIHTRGQECRRDVVDLFGYRSVALIRGELQLACGDERGPGRRAHHDRKGISRSLGGGGVRVATFTGAKSMVKGVTGWATVDGS